MKITFIRTQIFMRGWSRLGLPEEDIKVLVEDELKDNPERWDMIPGAGGIRKMRIQLEAKGKSGGARVLYVNFLYYGQIILVDVYAKSRQEDISPRQKRAYKVLVKEILKLLRSES